MSCWICKDIAAILQKKQNRYTCCYQLVLSRPIVPEVRQSRRQTEQAGAPPGSSCGRGASRWGRRACSQARRHDSEPNVHAFSLSNLVVQRRNFEEIHSRLYLFKFEKQKRSPFSALSRKTSDILRNMVRRAQVKEIRLLVHSNVDVFMMSETRKPSPVYSASLTLDESSSKPMSRS